MDVKRVSAKWLRQLADSHPTLQTTLGILAIALVGSEGSLPSELSSWAKTKVKPSSVASRLRSFAKQLLSLGKTDGKPHYIEIARAIAASADAVEGATPEDAKSILEVQIAKCRQEQRDKVLVRLADDLHMVLYTACFLCEVVKEKVDSGADAVDLSEVDGLK